MSTLLYMSHCQVGRCHSEDGHSSPVPSNVPKTSTAPTEQPRLVGERGCSVPPKKPTQVCWENGNLQGSPPEPAPSLSPPLASTPPTGEKAGCDLLCWDQAQRPYQPPSTNPTVLSRGYRVGVEERNSERLCTEKASVRISSAAEPLGRPPLTPTGPFECPVPFSP